jgi:hypothetical protein
LRVETPVAATVTKSVRVTSGEASRPSHATADRRGQNAQGQEQTQDQRADPL